jgi:hypothetical protein
MVSLFVLLLGDVSIFVVGKHYNMTGPEWNLEPHVALSIFNQMLETANVSVIYAQFVDEVEVLGPQHTE